MPEFSLTFRMNNAAFVDDPAGEVARILREVAGNVERGEGFTIGENEMRPIRDSNGNRVGEYCADLVDLDGEDSE